MTETEVTRLAFVCLGNICRSPMAHVVMQAKVDEAGLGDQFIITSAGTGSWHIGEPMDPRAAASLSAAGYDPSAHRASEFSSEWFDLNDLVLTMDLSNTTDVLDLARNDADRRKVSMFRSFDPQADDPEAEVPDPWYGGPDGFERVLAMVERTTNRIVDSLHLR